MAELARLFDNNRTWAAAQLRADPEYFARLAEQQTPMFLWIGCSDSRVPANQILGLKPGEVFDGVASGELKLPYQLSFVVLWTPFHCRQHPGRNHRIGRTQ